jgi:hypothetical protein
VSEPSLVIAQAQTLTSPFQQIGSSLGTDLGSSLLNVLKAIIILIVGWIVAAIVKSLVRSLLKKTDIDNRLASWVTGQRGGDFPVEEWISGLFFWLIILFAVVAFLNALQLEAVSVPLNSLLNEVTSFIPNLIGAGILLAVAWVVAALVRTIVTRGLTALDLDRRLGANLEDDSNFALSDTIGNALYWFIFLLFLPAILNTLSLEGTLAPVQGMLDEVLAILPNVLAAILIGVVGWFVAQVVRRIVSNLLSATGVDGIGEKIGLAAGGKQGLASIIGTIVFVLILIPTAIAALEALQIQAISNPAIDMLNQVLDLLPKLFAAGIVLAFFFIAGKFVAELVTNILTDIGFNNFLQWLGFTATPTPTPSTTTTIVTPSPESGFSETEQPTVIQSDSVTTKTPSEFVGLIVLVAIMLIATLTAVDILNIPALEAVIGVILTIAGRVLIGLVVFAIGLYFANLAYKLVLASGTYQASFLAQAARIAVIIFVSSLALTEMGIAPDVVNLAFGLTLGAVAIAIALSFGLGGRDVAREQLRSWLNSFKNQS